MLATTSQIRPTLPRIRHQLPLPVSSLAHAPNRFVLIPDPSVNGLVGMDTGSGFLVGVCEPKTNGVALTSDPKVGAVNLKAEKEDEEEEVGMASGILKVKDGCEGGSV